MKIFLVFTAWIAVWWFLTPPLMRWQAYWREKERKMMERHEERMKEIRAGRF